MNLSDSPITEDDFRAVVRILGEVASMEGSAHEKRTCLMVGLAELIQADAWIWTLAPKMEPGEQPVYLFHNTGGLDDTRMAKIIKAIEHPVTGLMTTKLAQDMIDTGSHVTRLRQDVISNEWFNTSPAKPLWDDADIGPILFSLLPLPDYGGAGVGLYRKADAPLFSEREARIAHIVLTEVPWLHLAELSTDNTRDIPSLPPRCRLILNQVVRGTSRKEIARDLGLSPHTVNDYMKVIFKHFNVHSQLELMGRLREGDGNDKNTA